jgi:hypothetical protein
MAAMESHSNRAKIEQILESYETPLIIGQKEGRHGIARSRCGDTGATILETGDQSVDCLGKFGAQLSYCVGDCLKTIIERGVEVTRSLKGVFQGLNEYVAH